MLSNAVVSLMSHVELDKVGWWDKGIRELIKVYLWIYNNTLSKDELYEGIQEEFSTEIEYQRFENQIAELIDMNQLIVFGDKYKLSEELYQRLNENSETSAEFTKQVKEKFETALSKLGLPPEIEGKKIWDIFNSTFLIPLVREMGVRVFENLSVDHSGFYSTVQFEDFLKKFTASDQPKLRDAIEDFLNPKDKSVRAYVLDYLKAYLLIESNKLNGKSITAIEKSMKNRRKLAIFVDTNFLFYLLKLDSGDFGKTAELLITLGEESKSRVDLKLYALPITIDEAQERIRQEIRDLSTIRNIPSIIKAASYIGLMSGIRNQYFTRIENAKYHIPPDKYFEPYLKSMPSMLRTNGVELFTEKIDFIKDKAEFIEDFNRQIEFQETKKNGKTKGRNALRHDILLWHLCNEKRKALGPMVSSGDSQYWVATVDYQLISFDKLKQRQSGLASDYCIFPSTLISMLQFWTPRSAAFEEAIITSIRPLLSRGFDPDAERVTLEILATLSRFEDIGDLSQETIIELLTDQGMRSRIANRESGVGRDTTQLIKDSLASQLEEKSRREQMLTSEIEKRDAELTSAQVELQTKDRQQVELTSQTQQLTERIVQIEVEKQARDKEIETLTESDLQKKQHIEDLENKIRQRESREQINAFIRNRLLLPAVLVIPFALISGYLLDIVNPYRVSTIVISLILFAILIYFILSLAESKGRNLEHVAQTKIIDRISKLKFLLALVIGFVFSIAANLISALIQLK